MVVCIEHWLYLVNCTWSSYEQVCKENDPQVTIVIIQWNIPDHDGRIQCVICIVLWQVSILYVLIFIVLLQSMASYNRWLNDTDDRLNNQECNNCFIICNIYCFNKTCSDTNQDTVFMIHRSSHITYILTYHSWNILRRNILVIFFIVLVKSRRS